MPNILQLMVRHGSLATAHYYMEYRPDIHGVDKTDKSKTYTFTFGEKALTYKILV